MLSTTHTLTSALIISKIPNPYLSFPLILVVHYAYDAIPHCDTGTGLTDGKKTKKKAFFLTLIDLAFAFTLVFLLFQINEPLSPILWLGIIFGISPDLIEFPALFLDLRPFPIKKLEEFHNRYHKRLKCPLGLIPQILIILLILIFR